MKKLDVSKKNLAKYAIIGTLVLTGMSLSGCGKNKAPETDQLSYIEEYAENNDINSMAITQYDADEKDIVLEYLDKEYYDDISPDIVADIQLEKKDYKQKAIIYTYFCYGYQAGKKCSSIQDAMNINEIFQNNDMFIEGYRQQKIDETFKKASRESRQYIQITIENSENRKLDDINYYPAEELTVISYDDGRTAIVSNYEEELVQSGQYQDLLGKNMSNYAGWNHTAESLKRFTEKHYEEMPDAEYIGVGSPNYIPQISNTNFVNNNVATTGGKTK